ncbi:MAG: hypothetical protein ABIR81_02780 [Ginsengibacter sp.]
MKATLAVVCVMLFFGQALGQKVKADSVDYFDSTRRIEMNDLPFTGTLKPYLSFICCCNKKDTSYILSIFIEAQSKTSLSKDDTLFINTKNNILKLGYSGIQSILKAQELFSFDVRLTADAIISLLSQPIQNIEVLTANERYHFNVVVPAQKYIIGMLNNLIRHSRSIAPKPFLNNGFQ